jgi:hypothetical protein
MLTVTSRGWTRRNIAICCKPVFHHAQGEPYGLQIGEIRLCGNAAMAELQTPLAGKVFHRLCFAVQAPWPLAYRVQAVFPSAVKSVASRVSMVSTLTG